MRSLRTLALTLALSTSGTLTVAQTPEFAAPQLQSMQARFAPVDIRVELKSLSENDRKALAKLIEASRYIDALFLRQRSATNEAQLLTLIADPSPLGQARLNYFILNKGPWSDLDEDRPFLQGVPEKPLSANF